MCQSSLASRGLYRVYTSNRKHTGVNLGVCGDVRMRLAKIDGFIRVYDDTKNLVLFGGDKYDWIYNRIISYGSKKWYYVCYFS